MPFTMNVSKYSWTIFGRNVLFIDHFSISVDEKCAYPQIISEDLPKNSSSCHASGCDLFLSDVHI